MSEMRFTLKPKRSTYQELKRGYTTGKRIGTNIGERLAHRMEENEALRQAVAEGDYVTRDEIMIQRMGRRWGIFTKLLFLPWLLTIFFGAGAFITGAALWVWSMYCVRRKIREMQWDIAVELGEICQFYRHTVTAALVTVFLMFAANAENFWIPTIGGWVVTMAIAGIAWMKMTTYFEAQNVALVRALAEQEAEEVAAAELTEEEMHEQSKDEEIFTSADLARLAADNIIYGFSKPIPHVFDVPDGYPAGIGYHDRDRFRHSYIIGKTGSGKSVFLRNAILQDIKKGRGVILLTHERVMFEKYIMPYYPSERIDDLIYYNPADTRGKIVGFNILELNKGENPAFKAGEIYTVFERTIDDLGASMKPILANAIDALVCMNTGKNLRDLKTLIDPEANRNLVREIVTSPHVEDEVKRFWQHYSESSAARTGFEPLKHRLRPLLREPLITTLSMGSFKVSEEVNHHQRVILLDLSDLRGPQQRMTGQFLIALLRETFYARDVVCPDKNFLDYSFYIDEFQEYAGHSEEALLEVFNGLRKYNIGLTIAHQTTHSISSRLLGVIMGNVGTVGALRLQESEANYFAKELRIYERRAVAVKKKERIEDVEAKYREIYHGNHPQKATILKTLHTKIQRMKQEAALREEEDEPENDPTLKLRADLLVEPIMPELHIMLRGSKTTSRFTQGTVFVQFPFEPIIGEKEEIFEYEDYVMASQEKYGKEIPPETPQAPPDDDDDYTTTRKL